MRITDRFRTEHVAFVAELDVLRALLDAGADPHVFRDTLRRLAAPLADHAQREEDVLFGELGADDDARAPIQILTAEHDLIEDHLARMEELPAAPALRALFDELELTLRGHIEREDSVMFPLAERILSAAELSSLDAAPLTALT